MQITVKYVECSALTLVKEKFCKNQTFNKFNTEIVLEGTE